MTSSLSEQQATSNKFVIDPGPETEKHPIEAYVASLGGKRPIRKVLIANNGIAAVKAIRSIRRWSYETFGDEHAVEFVSMATPEDVAANAEYVRMADMWTSVPGGSNNHNFANVDLITDIAERFSCDAVWAGWGHASENPVLPAKLSSLGITFLGPNPKSMHALGDKIASTIIAQSANVPTVAWSGSGLTVDYSETGSVPEDIYKRACVLSADHAKRVAEDCGYPLVVKASEGGGGKGIRVVFEENAICAAYRQVASEVPGSPIFLMRLVQNARHLEVQIVADESGDAIALYGRDCSVQRRHQKIIEEGPVVAAPPRIWKGLEKAAVALAKEVGYVGAGTVEYLYKGDKNSGEFYFLELNPRLQVEHPVTEWITGVNLPALQLHIGMGIPLSNVATIRKFLNLPGLSSALNDAEPSSFVASPLVSVQTPVLVDDTANGVAPPSVSPVPPHGHVIACRVTAENPDEGFQPTSGAIQELTFRNTPNVWGYFSVGASGGVHEFADSQFGHLFAWGEDRESSRRSLVLALKELSIRGDIRTTVEYLIKLLEMKAFRENTITTSWLDSLIAEKMVAEKPPTDLAVIVGAVCRAHMHFAKRAKDFTECLGRGQLPLLDRSLVEIPIELIYDDVKYCFQVSRSALSAFRVRLVGDGGETDGDSSVLAEVRTLADGAKLVLINGRSHVCYARKEPAGLRLSIDGKTCLFPKEYDPTRLTSSVSGKLVRYLVENDEHVNVGQPYVELEVMKMYLTLSAPECGTLRRKAAEATSIEMGEVIAVLELDDPSKVRRAERFQGELPIYAVPQALGSRPHQRFHAAKNEVALLLRGFDARQSSLEDFMDTIDDIRVCAGEVRESLSSLSGRIPTAVSQGVEEALRVMLQSRGVTEGKQVRRDADLGGHFSISEDTAPLSKEDWLSGVSAVSSSVSRILELCEGIPEAGELVAVAHRYSNGTVLASTVASLLDEYLDIEKLFARRTGGAGDALFELRDENKNDLSTVFEVGASHVRLKEKNVALVNFLEALTRPAPAAVLAEDNVQTAEFKARLHQLSQLYASEYSDIALRARLMLADLRRPHFHQRRSSVGNLLQDIVGCSETAREEQIRNMVGLSEPILDVLLAFVLPAGKGIVSAVVRKIAAEVLLLGSYRAYEVFDLNVSTEDGAPSTSTLTATWRFRFQKPEASNSFQTASSTKDIRKSQISRGITSFDSADNLSAGPGGGSGPSKDESFRVGILAAFSHWNAMEEQFDNVLQRHANRIHSSGDRDVNVMTVLLRWDATDFSSPSNSSSHLPESPRTGSNTEHGEGVRDPFAYEAVVSHALSEFCKAKASRHDMAAKAGLKSLTFIVAPSTSSESVTYPGFYTFRVRDCFQEDPIYRHIDPPMAFQLELSRLSNFSITRFGYPTRAVHVFFAQDKSKSRRKGEDISVRQKRPPRNESFDMEVKSFTDKAPSPNSELPAIGATHAEKDVTASSKSGILKKGTHRADRDVDARFFVRAVIRQADVFSNSRDGAVVSMPEAERTFVEALDAVEMASCDRRFRRTDFNHIFLNIIPPVQIDIDDVEAICRRMFQRYANRCWSLRVFVVEIKVPALVEELGSPSRIIPLRFLLFNPTGHMLRVESYVESTDRSSGVEKIISVSQDNPGSLHGSLLSEPYPVMDRVQRRRVLAQAMETTYVYDFLQIFTTQLLKLWRRYSEERLLGGFRRHKMPVSLIDSTELILSNNSAENEEPLLSETKRKAGLNDIGMVAWLCTLRTPEYPNGRDVVVIGNDITFRSGSFGPDEDTLFYAASKMSRERGIPRIYLAANSGARIGVAEEIRDRMQVQWIDPSMPSRGFKGLALKSSDLSLVSPYVKTGEEYGDDLHEICDVIGAEHGLGVENLMGSGLIAGETSRAYDETFTITYVTARCVGIGAYLVRLGQRVIQKESAAPIILTGFSALNKVLGHDVYISNEQLGGAKIMFPNGISHSVVTDDVQGVGAILNWLSYVPRVRGDPLPIVESRDPVSRAITTSLPVGGQPYDPRLKLIAGEVDASAGQRRFLGAMFDKDSWREYLEGWAKTVIVGRARLGGVPTGIVAVETRSVERLTPADPASPETRESVVTQAGQVWYPDSAAKTARAIMDFDREGLPLFILANWRGFSGGMRDMFDEILKSGSEIVDALRLYKQPVFVYIPPGGELRGGAWVVLDTLINPEKIEMYADSRARGGVLEPDGTVDVKYRRRNILKTMHRLDPQLCKLDEELTGAKSSGGLLSDERKRSIHEAIYAREAEILPVYRNVAASFCDLHDTPRRLLAKGAIRSIVNWKDARSFFYWRLQRRLAEERVRSKLSAADPTLSTAKMTGLLKKWAADYMMESGVNGHTIPNGDVDIDSFSRESETMSFENDDKLVFHWLEVEEDALDKKIEKIRISRIAARVNESCTESREGFLDGVEAALRNCKSSSERSKLTSAIQEKIGLVTSSGTTSSSSALGILSRLGKLGWDRET